MSLGYFSYPMPANEPVLSYAPGSPEKKRLKEVLVELKKEQIDVPMYIGSKEVRTNKKGTLHPPHEIAHTLGTYSEGDERHVKQAIDAALAAKESWANMDWETRANIFLKAADLMATKYRPYMNGTTMLGQSKNAYQPEIDAACELIDFLRFNVHFLSEIYKQQPISSPGMHNRMEYRPLEGFVLAITPFNFTAIGGNLPTIPALMGNTVVWKPSEKSALATEVVMRVLEEAGLPPGVINKVHGSGADIAAQAVAHEQFAGLNFIGSTAVLRELWAKIGSNVGNYRSYPRIVGETGGKNAVVAHPSADPQALLVALVRGAFEHQGQKCSAASRAYLPRSL